MKKIEFNVDKLFSEVSPKIYELGNEYFNLKKVSDINFDSYGGEIVVNSVCNGYKNHFEIFDDKLRSFYCQCYVGSKSIICKHIVASILKLNTFANSSFDDFLGVNIKNFHTTINNKNIGSLIKVFANEKNWNNFFDILINNNNFIIEINDFFKFISYEQFYDFINFLKKINNNKKINNLYESLTFLEDIFSSLMNKKNKAFISDDEIENLFNVIATNNLFNWFSLFPNNEKINIDKFNKQKSLSIDIDVVTTNIGYFLSSSTTIINYINGSSKSYLIIKDKSNKYLLIELPYIDESSLKNIMDVNTTCKDLKSFNKKIQQLNEIKNINFNFNGENKINEYINITMSSEKGKIIATITNDDYKNIIIKNNTNKLLNYFDLNNTYHFNKQSEFEKFLTIINNYKYKKLVKIKYDKNFIDLTNKEINFNFKLKNDNEIDFHLDVDGELITINDINDFYKQRSDNLKIINTNNYTFFLDNFNISNINKQFKIMNINGKNIDRNKIFYIAKEFKEEEFIKFANAFENRKVNLNIDSSILKQLKGYQLDGVKWIKKMLDFSGGCLLADEMGLGKTFQSIAYINDLRKRNNKPILIISPFSLIDNWKQEFAKFDSSSNVIEIEGDLKKRKYIISQITDNNIYLANYHKFINDINFYSDYNFSLIILDEGQYIKNKKTIWSKNIKKIKADERLILTGTPIENNIMDIWSLFDFILSNYLPSEKEYKRLFLNNNLEELSFLIKPFILQRTKIDHLPELKVKVNNSINIKMSDSELDYYNKIYNDIKIDINDYFVIFDSKLKTSKKNNILAKITTLRQFCCDQRIINPKLPQGNKTKKLIELIKKIQKENKKIIVFSSFVTALELIKQDLDELNIFSMLFLGSVSKKERSRIIQEFSNIEQCILLISLKAGGVGLNLTSSNVVIHFNPWWNDSVENQATDRVHRIGQEKTVKVYNMIYQDSIEQYIVDLKKQKNDIVNSTINSTNYIELFKMINNK